MSSGVSPYTCFLLSFIHIMVEIETKAKHIRYINNQLFILVSSKALFVYNWWNEMELNKRIKLIELRI
jgi:hypothetical protein